MRVPRTVLVHRTEEHACELPPAAAHHEELGPFGSLDQGRDGVAVHEYRRDRKIGVSLFKTGDQRLELLSEAFNRIRFMEHRSPDVGETSPTS